MGEKKVKTNAMRALDSKKISYETICYEVDETDLSGMHAAKQVGLNPNCVFKTLVLHGDKTGYLVACIPVSTVLNLKELAKQSGNKKTDMIPVKDLLPLTGYVRGGCSPIGMKKGFPVFIDSSVLNHPRVAFSAGMRGCQVLLSPQDMVSVTKAILCTIASLTEDEGVS